MSPQSSVRVMCLFIVVGIVTVAAQTAKLTTTWAAPGVGPLDFAGKRVVALALTDDMSLKMSAEEALAREITARGPQGVAAYRVIPKEELVDKDRVQKWFTSANIAGAVTLRVVKVDKDISYPSVMFGASYYQSFSSYYAYSTATIVPIGSPREDTTLAVETLLYDVSNGGKLLWAGMSETTNPKNVQEFMKGLAKAVGNDLEKQGLVKKK